MREMRRKRQALDRKTCEEILQRGTYGVLAVQGDDVYPYTVPLNYAYADGTIIFHSAKEGHKVDAMRRSEKVSFCVVDKDTLIPEEYTTYFRSVIAFGRVHRLLEPKEIRDAIELLMQKVYPSDTPEHRRAYLKNGGDGPAMFAITVESLSGKEAIELVREREAKNGKA